MHNKKIMRRLISRAILPFAVLLLGCNHPTNLQTMGNKTNTIHPRYAKGFSITRNGDSTTIIVYDPWKQGSIYAEYKICNGCNQLSSIKKQELSIAPNDRAAIFSSTAIGYLKLLGSESVIAGITDGNHIYDSLLRKKYRDGKLPALGQNMIDNFEAIVDLMPDFLVKSGFEQSPAADARYMKTGIPVLYINDWTEKHPLARAEWIKYIACFLGKEKQADSIFTIIESRYLAIKEKTADLEKLPTVMAGGEYKGTWYVPGGQSYFATFIADAHGKYSWDTDTSIGSLSLSLESVVEKNIDDQYWFTTHQLPPAQLQENDTRYALLRSVRQGNLYSYAKRIAPNGANDYWESGVCRPDIVLQDLATILHPDLFPGDLYYYTKLTDSAEAGIIID